MLREKRSLLVCPKVSNSVFEGVSKLNLNTRPPADCPRTRSPSQTFPHSPGLYSHRVVPAEQRGRLGIAVGRRRSTPSTGQRPETLKPHGLVETRTQPLLLSLLVLFIPVLLRLLLTADRSRRPRCGRPWGSGQRFPLAGSPGAAVSRSPTSIGSEEETEEDGDEQNQKGEE